VEELKRKRRSTAACSDLLIIVERGADLKPSKLNKTIISGPTRLEVSLGRRGVRSMETRQWIKVGWIKR
jgi:hypothetical protein